MKNIQFNSIYTLIVCFVSLLLLLSCSKDDAPAPTPNPADAQFRIKQVQYASGLSSTYEYNAQNKMTKNTVNDGRFVKYNYNSQGQMVSQESANNPDVSSNYLTNYVYDTSGGNIEQIITRGDGSKTKYVYTNNSNNLPITSKYYYWNPTTNTWIEGSNDTYTYNGNNQRIKYERDSEYSLSSYDTRGNENENKQFVKKPDGSYYLTYQSNRTYDDKKAIQLYPNVANINNPTDFVSKTFLQDGSLSTQSSLTISYEYNEAGYVTKSFYNGSLSATYTLEKAN